MSARTTKRRLVLHVKTLLTKLAKDLGIGPSDLAYVLRRLHHEGLSFVTKILPTFAKFAVRCCDQQCVLPRETLTSFNWKGRSPLFLRGLLLQAINGCAQSLYSIRQFCEYFYKTSFGFDPTVIAAAQRKYITVDKDLCYEQNRNAPFEEACRKNLHRLFAPLCDATVDDVFDCYRPYDGPGAFSGSQSTSDRHGVPYEVFKRLGTDQIGSHNRVFNAFSGYFRAYPSSRERIVPVSEEKVSELLFVPKDSRGPRTISKEPYFLMKAQMAAGAYTARMLEVLSHRRVNFKDQSINQALARESSVSRENATLDLKDASDRVSYSLVSRLVQHTRALRYFVTKARSTHVRMPDGTLHRLHKFANMGSGMCFPILALVVYLAAVTGIQKATGLPLNKVAKMVYVYGDDLIVPSRYMAHAVYGLKTLGLLVNEDKSFVRGNFRESCGGDYFHGVDVGPVRLGLSGERLDPVSQYRNGHVPVTHDAGLLQLERHCRELVDASLFNVAKFLYRSMQKTVPLPKVGRESAVLGIYDPDNVLGLPGDDVGYVPQSLYANDDIDRLCPYKMLGRALRSSPEYDSLYSWEERIAKFSGMSTTDSDPYLTPLRYRLKLKKVKVLEQVDVFPYGLTISPRYLFGI